MKVKITKDYIVELDDVKRWSTQEIYNIISLKRENTEIYFTVQYIDCLTKVQADIAFLVPGEMEQDAVYGMYQRLVALSAPYIGLICSDEPGELITTPEQVAYLLRKRNVDTVAWALDVLIKAKQIRILDTGEYYITSVPKMVLGRNWTDGKGRQKTWNDVNKTASHSEYVRQKQLEKQRDQEAVERVRAAGEYVCDDDELPYPGQAVQDARAFMRGGLDG